MLYFDFQPCQHSLGGGPYIRTFSVLAHAEDTCSVARGQCIVSTCNKAVISVK